eukprot:SAG31_NODE_3733_length_3940_cov_2.160115_1_plen_73_part_10
MSCAILQSETTHEHRVRKSASACRVRIDPNTSTNIAAFLGLGQLTFEEDGSPAVLRCTTMRRDRQPLQRNIIK